MPIADLLRRPRALVDVDVDGGSPPGAVSIADLYRGLLGREPDVEGLRHYQEALASGRLTWAEMLSAFVGSEEFRNRPSHAGLPLSVHNANAGCLPSEAEAVFARLPRYTGEGRRGYVTSFLGVLTSVAFVHNLESLDGTVEGYPIPANFHGDMLEWMGALRSVLEASDRFAMLELGAGWGPWCAIAHRAARSRGIGGIRVVGVEGDAGHVAHMRENFAVNGIAAPEGEIVAGVVGPCDGEAQFPRARDASQVFSGAPAFPGQAQGSEVFDRFMTDTSDYVEAVDTVACHSLATLLEPLGFADLIHCDIQGEEGRLFAASIDVVNEKVGRVVVGTHSFEIDRQLAMLFGRHGWVLEGLQPCEMRESRRETGPTPVLTCDGTQVWRNPRKLD